MNSDGEGQKTSGRRDGGGYVIYPPAHSCPFAIGGPSSNTTNVKPHEFFDHTGSVSKVEMVTPMASIYKVLSLQRHFSDLAEFSHAKSQFYGRK